ncbi:MAG: DUF58 domain-containing protein [Thermomicrobiales bacterium]
MVETKQERKLSPQSSVLSPPLLDEAFLRRLEKLQLRSRRSFTHGIAGEHRSIRRGTSPEFADYKPYTPGDDFRRVDWNIYARMGEMFVRLSEVNIDLAVHLLVDRSRSMDWGEPNKFLYAKRAAAALGYLALAGFDRVTVAPFVGEPGRTLGPLQGRSRAAGLFQFLTSLPAADGTTDLAHTLRAYVNTSRRPGYLILFSDLLTTTSMEDAFAILVERGWQIVILQTLSPWELHPTLDHDVELEDVESGEHIRIRPTPETFATYQTRFDAWLDEVAGYCKRYNITYVRIATDIPFEDLATRTLIAQGVLE